MKRLILTTTVVLGLLAGLLLMLMPPSAAGASCPFTYTVIPGDTLSSIAYRAGTSVWYLARINGIWNPNYIYSGRVLCLPNPINIPDSTVQPGDAHSTLELVATHTFDPSADPDAGGWTLGRNHTAGKRLKYSLLSGDAIETFAEPQNVLQASVNASPLLWLVRADFEGTTYKLVAIGDPTPLLDLQMEVAPTQNIADIIPAPDPDRIGDEECPETQQPVSKLSISGKSTVVIKGELVTAEGIFIPIDVVAIDYHETAQIAETCHTEIGFALHPTANPDTDGYKLLMVLNDDGTIGPPGQRWRRVCFRWSGGGWWSRWRRSWWGC